MKSIKISDEAYKELKEIAKKNKRTMKATIELLLEEGK